MQPKEKEKREATPAEQWDAVAFKLIKDELVPKGYSEIKRGPWRGKVQSNIPFLPKQSVERCQKISAQMVRTFRMKVLSILKQEMESNERKAEATLKLKQSHAFWEFKKKRVSDTVEKHFADSAHLIKTLINDIENIGIK